MDYKTKIKITAVVALIIIAVIFVLMIWFVTTNKDKGLVKSTNKENISKESVQNDINLSDDIDLNNVKSFALQDHYIVAIESDGNTKKVFDIESKENADFKDIAFDEELIYLVFYENSNTNIYSFNLSENELKLVLELENLKYNDECYIDVFDGNIYLKTANSLTEYSISSGEFSDIITNTSNENSITGKINHFVIDKSNEKIYLSAIIDSESENTMGVYSFDIEKRELYELITLETPASDLILNNNILAVCVPEYKFYYLYNIDEGKVYEIGEEHITEKEHGMIGKVAIFDDFIVYNDEEKIFIEDFYGNKKEEKFTNSDKEKGYYYNISKVTDNTIQIISATYDSKVKPYKSVILNLDTGDITEIEEMYFKVINIK